MRYCEKKECEICRKDFWIEDMTCSNREWFCDDCAKEIDLGIFEIIKRKLYQWYKEEWCSNRGHKVEDIDIEIGTPEGIYACYEEFLDNEWHDDKYINYLCNKHGYPKLEDLGRGYGLIRDIDMYL